MHRCKKTNKGIGVNLILFFFKYYYIFLNIIIKMPKEYEYVFQNFDKDKIINKLKKLGGVYKGTFLFRVQQFDPPPHIVLPYNIRVRDEEYRTTMTIKIPTEDFDDEWEVIIDDFDDGVQFLLNLGFTKQRYYEKVREIYHIRGRFNFLTQPLWNEYTEIIFDTEEGFPEIMEIESKTFNQLQKMYKIFSKYISL